MGASRDVFVTVVIPTYNSMATIGLFLDDLTRVLSAHYHDYEILVVDDDSTDETTTIISQLFESIRGVRLVELSRHMGREIVITAGLEASIGDVVVIACPETDPPDEIPAMVGSALAGSDIVAGVTDKSRRYGFLHRILRRLFYRIAKFALSIELNDRATDFRVLSRRVVNAIVDTRQKTRYYSVLLHEIGFSMTTHEFTEREAPSPRLTRNLLSEIRDGFSFIFANSMLPARMISVCALVGSGLSASYALYAIVVNLVLDNVVEGWTTTSLVLSGLFFLNFLVLAFFSEYLSRLLIESTDRPLYYVRAERHSVAMLSEGSKQNVRDDSMHASRSDEA